MPLRATLILLSYNQRHFLEEAVSACFAQQCEPIEILLSDDASTDGSHELLVQLAAAYQGPHTVRVRRNPQNLGIAAHYNTAIENSMGELLITAAGDDISLPHRVNALLRAWDNGGQKADLIASHLIDMTADGLDVGQIKVADLSRWASAQDWVRKRPYVVGASHAFTRRMHLRFGPISADVAYEDQVMALRACCMGGGITVNDALLRYRRGGVSARNGSTQTAGSYLAASHRKHARQRAWYAQIRADLHTAGLIECWRGKARRNHQRSELALALLQAPSLRPRMVRAMQPSGAGWFWALRHALLYSFPALAVSVQRWQHALNAKR